MELRLESGHSMLLLFSRVGGVPNKAPASWQIAVHFPTVPLRPFGRFYWNEPQIGPNYKANRRDNFALMGASEWSPGLPLAQVTCHAPCPRRWASLRQLVHLNSQPTTRHCPHLTHGAPANATLGPIIGFRGSTFPLCACANAFSPLCKRGIMDNTWTTWVECLWVKVLTSA